MMVRDRHSRATAAPPRRQLRLRAEEARAPRLGPEPREDQPHRLTSVPQRPDDQLRPVSPARSSYAWSEVRRGAGNRFSTSHADASTSQGTDGLIPNSVTGASCDSGERRDLREVPAKSDHREQFSGDELATGCRRRRAHSVRGSGHPARRRVPPQAHAPQASEPAGGSRRSSTAAPGTRSSKPLQRLHVDPMAIYGRTASSSSAGTKRSRGRSCCASCTSLQPKLVVVMGEPAVAFLNAARFPLARELGLTEGELQEPRRRSRGSSRPTSTSRSTSSRRKTAFWNAFKVLGEWWSQTPPY